MEILGSLIIAILQSILFYGKRLGISVILFMIATIGIIWFMLYKKRKIINTKAAVLLIPILLLSSTYFIYGSTIFDLTNMIVIFGLIILMLKIATTEKIITKDLLIKSIQLPYRAIEEVENAQREINKIIKEASKNKIPKENLKKIISSILITVAVVGFVIILLASADSIGEIKWQEFNISKYKIKDNKLHEIVDFEELEIKAMKEEREEEYRKNREEKTNNFIKDLSGNEA